MIPTAQVLADILNDPAIPAEAKPEWARDRPWRTSVFHGQHEGVYCDLHAVAVGHLAETANAALFWSLSAWLWGRDVYVWVEPSRHGGWFAAEDCGEGGPHVYPTAPSPVEALAAVVREVAALGTLPP